MRGSPEKITTSQVIGTSGKPLRVYHVSLMSGGAASTLKLYNGTDATTIHRELTGTSGEAKEFDFGEQGIFFPAGCYAAVDANITYATIDREKWIN